MAHEGNGSAVYTVVYSGFIRQRIAELASEAKSRGDDRFSKSLGRIVRRLETDPLAFGEVLHHLAHLKLAVCIGAIRPLFVRFAVHQELRLVFLTDLGWLMQDDA